MLIATVRPCIKKSVTAPLVTKDLTQRVFPYKTVGRVGAQGMEPAIVSSCHGTTGSALFSSRFCRIVTAQSKTQLFGHFRTQ